MSRSDEWYYMPTSFVCASTSQTSRPRWSENTNWSRRVHTYSSYIIILCTILHEEAHLPDAMPLIDCLIPRCTRFGRPENCHNIIPTPFTAYYIIVITIIAFGVHIYCTQDVQPRCDDGNNFFFYWIFLSFIYFFFFLKEL